MPHLDLPHGLYWIFNDSPKKGVKHHAILDVGNRLGYPDVSGWNPVIVHQTPPVICREPLGDPNGWHLVGRIADERGAIQRIVEACANPLYAFISNNCEHFARYVATGVRESKQVQGAGVLAGIVALFFVALRAEASA